MPYFYTTRKVEPNWPYVKQQVSRLAMKGVKTKTSDHETSGWREWLDLSLSAIWLMPNYGCKDWPLTSAGEILDTDDVWNVGDGILRKADALVHLDCRRITSPVELKVLSRVGVYQQQQQTRIKMLHGINNNKSSGIITAQPRVKKVGRTGANEEESIRVAYLYEIQSWLLNVSAFIFLGWKHDGKWPVLSLAVSSCRKHCAVRLYWVGLLRCDFEPEIYNKIVGYMLWCGFEPSVDIPASYPLHYIYIYLTP